MLLDATTPDETNDDARPLADVLEEVERFLTRYVVLGRPEARVAVVLWVAHTHAITHADVTPYLAVYSPEKQSGKTRLLECLAVLARESRGPLVMPTASTIFRSLDASPDATLLIDELDAVFRDRSDKYEEVRAVINAGHRRGATVPRSVPGPRSTWVVKDFPVFGAKALAGIGKLPDTVADRSIPVRMLKRKWTEPVERFRHREASEQGRAIGAQLSASLAVFSPSREADVPTGLPDRAADAWEPLLAIADRAGGSWPSRARTAALVLHATRQADDSLGLRLLSDLRVLFGNRRDDRISTANLVGALARDDEGPWGDQRLPLTPHRLAKLLAPFEIHSRQMRIGDLNVKGYEATDFVDAWDRYLPPPASGQEEPKQRNDEPEARIDVSEPGAGSDDARIELPLEHSYPGASKWAAQDAGSDDLPPDELWIHAGTDVRGRQA